MPFTTQVPERTVSKLEFPSDEQCNGGARAVEVRIACASDVLPSWRLQGKPHASSSVHAPSLRRTVVSSRNLLWTCPRFCSVASPVPSSIPDATVIRESLLNGFTLPPSVATAPYASQLLIPAGRLFTADTTWSLSQTSSCSSAIFFSRVCQRYHNDDPRYFWLRHVNDGQSGCRERVAV